jgi:hypothetical protein
MFVFWLDEQFFNFGFGLEQTVTRTKCSADQLSPTMRDELPLRLNMSRLKVKGPIPPPPFKCIIFACQEGNLFFLFPPKCYQPLPSSRGMVRTPWVAGGTYSTYRQFWQQLFKFSAYVYSFDL